jgi:Gpi18-like mannosyltransferase
MKGHLISSSTSSPAAPQPNSTSLTDVILIGILLSHLSHLASSLVLYQLVLLLTPQSHSAQSRRCLAFLSAALHVLSPAGVFLSAPYTEAPFALCSFLGSYCYVRSWTASSSNGRDDPTRWVEAQLWTLAAGVCFGAATLLRSNGLFFGAIFAYDALLWGGHLTMSVLSSRLSLIVVALTGAVCATVLSYGTSISLPEDLIPTILLWVPIVIFTMLPGSPLHSIRPWMVRVGKVLKGDLERKGSANIVSTVISGLLVGIGFIWPQYLAYQEFCIQNSDVVNVPWCSEFPPSIYTSIQSRYWYESCHIALNRS